MKLDEFVTQTLLDITNGVAAAQEKTLLFIAPAIVEGEKKTKSQTVSFEISITVNAEGGGGISVFSMGDIKGALSRETANRISFEIPVYFSVPTRANPRHPTNKGSLNPVYEEEIK